MNSLTCGYSEWTVVFRGCGVVVASQLSPFSLSAGIVPWLLNDIIELRHLFH
jgi:hypothetical protein